MGGNKSGTSAGASGYDYYGTISAAVCNGPVDVLYAVLADGKAIWEDEAGLERGTEDAVNLFSAMDPKWFYGSGGFWFHWGTSGGAAWATGQPGYYGVAGIYTTLFWFGTGKTTAPNLEVICARKPVCDTSLCAASDNVLLDGQANPVAILGELFTSIHGLAQPIAKLDATSWAAAAAYARTNYSKTFCSPLLTDHSDARAAIASLLRMFDGALYWTASGTLGLVLLKPGINPGGLTTLDAAAWTDKPRMRAGGWGQVPTGFILRYTDRDRKWKTADEKLDNLLALHVRGEDDRANVDLPHVTRRGQVLTLAAELVRRHQHPVSTMDIAIRREMASGLTPGQKLLVDVEPEPGGDSLAQLATVKERRDPGNGPVSLSLECDPIATSSAYTPTFTPDEAQEADVASIEYALIVPLSVAATGLQPSIAVLAARPQDDCTGFELSFGTSTDFALLGRQEGFALRMTLEAAVAEDDTVLQLTLTDGADGRDAYLAGRTAGDAITAQADHLLAILANVTDGVIDVDGDGNPDLESVSIVSRSAVDTDTHDYTVLRARKSFSARAWTTAAQVWIIPGANFVPWLHEQMLSILNSGDTGHIRLSSFTAYTADASSPLPEFDFVFPSAYDALPAISWTTPAASPYDLATTGELTPEATITDADGNLVRIELYSVNAASGAQTKHADIPLGGSASVTLADIFTLAGVSGTIDLGTQDTEDQYFTLTLRATDAAGYIVSSSLALVLPGSSGSGVGAIEYDPVPISFVTSIVVTLTATGSGATQIHYALGAWGSGEPSGYSTVSDTVKVIQLYDATRVWARASDGSNHSPWQSGDYWKESYQ